MFGRKARKLCLVGLIMALVFCTTGCTKVTQENYEKLGLGMDYSEVTAILGTATECDDSSFIKNCSWVSKEKSIKLTFVMDKLIYRCSNGLGK